jgi:hypothetical protein
VVWIIFDEMDQQIAFERSDVHLPEFTRFRETALYATNAYAPSSGTITSIPALLIGKPIKSARQVGPDELRLLYTPGAGPPGWVRWDKQRSSLTVAREMGINSAVVGWFHPYCRVLNSDVAFCFWEPMPFQADTVSRKFPESLIDYLRSLLETSVLSPFGQSLGVNAAVERFQSVAAAASAAAADRSYGLVFLHVQPPHSPHAYNRRDGRFTLHNAPITGYLDSLALADLTLGQIRAAMERTGVWEESTVLLSSDHWYRAGRMLTGVASSGRVPFLLKVGGHSGAGSVYSRRLETVKSAHLVEAILRGKVPTLSSAMQWLDAAEPHTACSAVKR